MGTAFRRPNLTSTDGPRAERVNTFCIISDVIVPRHLLSYYYIK